MNTNVGQHNGNVAELPQYRALLVVDVMDFSGRRGREHAELTEVIPRLLKQALNRCGLSDLWERVRFEVTTGDGYTLGFDATVLPFLLNPFLAALQDELEFQNAVRPGHPPLRMRVSVNVGPLTDSGRNAISDGSGTPRVETHRLLDAEPVKALLSRSSSVTCIAAIVSERAFEDAVLSGYTGEDPSLYVPAPVTVKSYEGNGYLRVPRPSGELLIHGFHPTPPTEEQPMDETKRTEPPMASHTNTAGDVSGSAVQARDYHDGRQVGVGSVAGHMITGNSGPVNTGDHAHVGHQFSGSGVTYVAGDHHGQLGRADQSDGQTQ
ncbi:hypothetical protein [Allokutzneria albata]|uniref:Guanylate cyclase domain-containing protein n=1 Tax=Allokutzneria albata TaxID=211114 RepID=A0A1G9Y753_ALLAB|nr:hypothetical protein [Allokutzneria albata]SDN04283.1 hypothetical protein SAMN04489726_4612 [Allokutzneria albata]